MQLEIFGPTFHLGEPKRMSSESPPKNIRLRLYPSYQEMMDHGYKRDYLGMIRVTNPLKLHYAIHQEVLKDIVDALEMHLDIIPKKLEVCLDTTDPYKGKLMIVSALPSYFKPSMLYHFDQDGKMVRGPSPIGEHEYVGYRPKGRKDNRPTSERPRGGRRVCHPHIHVEEIRGHAVHIYRCEYQLYTTYLRELMKRRKIYDLTTLLNFLPYLSPRLFRFRTLDLERLHRHRPNTRQLRLETLSIRGQYYVLSQNGFKPKEISRYLKVAPVPEIVLYDDHDPGPSRIPCAGIFIIIGLQDSTLIELPLSADLINALWVDLRDYASIN